MPLTQVRWGSVALSFMLPKLPAVRSLTGHKSAENALHLVLVSLVFLPYYAAATHAVHLCTYMAVHFVYAFWRVGWR